MASPQANQRGRRQRTTHSMDAVLTEAVALLDEAGDSALTFRALAGRLGGGVASIYWYVSSKDELIVRAADHALVEVLAGTDRLASQSDPIAALRTIAMKFFAAIQDRPWLSAYFMRNPGLQPNALVLYERIGQQILRLGLGPKDSFNAVSAVTGFVVGIAADMNQEPPREVVEGDLTREQFVAQYAEVWRELDPSEFPFIHHIVDEFAHHDDADQFEAGLDLLLAGLRLQAGEPMLPHDEAARGA